jgi:hypothetical protein
VLGLSRRKESVVKREGSRKKGKRKEGRKEGKEEISVR